MDCREPARRSRRDGQHRAFRGSRGRASDLSPRFSQPSQAALFWRAFLSSLFSWRPSERKTIAQLKRFNDIGEELAKRFAAVAGKILYLRGEFGKCLAEGREEENGVVAEALRAARRFEQFSFNAVGDDGQNISRASQSDDADEMRLAIPAGLAVHFHEQFGDAFRVAGVFAGVTRRVNSGRAAERRDNQTRIIGEDRFVRHATVMQRFSGGILGERGRVFGKRRQSVEARQSPDLERLRRRKLFSESAVLAELSCVGRGEKKFSGPAH